MHNDGLVVNNRQSTDWESLFLEDALSFLANEFGCSLLPARDDPIRKFTRAS